MNIATDVNDKIWDIYIYTPVGMLQKLSVIIYYIGMPNKIAIR